METKRKGASAQIEKALKNVERTQKWTADKAGIAHTTFHRKMNGGSDWTVSELARIANVLGVAPAELLPEEFHAQALAA